MKTTKSLEQVRAEKDHLTMMQTPDYWPIWPYLPLRNRSREKAGVWNPVLGFLMDSSELKFSVIIGCLGITTENFKQE